MLPTQRDASTIQLDVGYRGSVLARDDRDDPSALRAGDRAPDATGLTTTKGRRRLFDLIGGGLFTLLVFVAEDAGTLRDPRMRVLHVADQPRGIDQIGDPDDQLAQTYGASDQTLTLIRPDGYVGLITDTGDTQAVTRSLIAMGYRSAEIVTPPH